jgi:hypothetical protein
MDLLDSWKGHQMIKHIEGTKAGDRVTSNTPVGSRISSESVQDEFSVVNINGPIIQSVSIHGGGTLWIELNFDNYASNMNNVITPGPLPWHHRAWNWIAERWGK